MVESPLEPFSQTLITSSNNHLIYPSRDVTLKNVQPKSFLIEAKRRSATLEDLSNSLAPTTTELWLKKVKVTFGDFAVLKRLTSARYANAHFRNDSQFCAKNEKLVFTFGFKLQQQVHHRNISIFHSEKKLFLKAAFYDPCRVCGALYEPF